MKIIFFAAFLSFTFIQTFSQVRRDAIWCFGDSVQLNFNHQPPSVNYCATRNRGSACSIADSSGNLLFYAHTHYYPAWQNNWYALGVVWNKNHEVMENGDSLYAGGWYKEMVTYGITFSIPELPFSAKFITPS